MSVPIGYSINTKTCLASRLLVQTPIILMISHYMELDAKKIDKLRRGEV